MTGFGFNSSRYTHPSSAQQNNPPPTAPHGRRFNPRAIARAITSSRFSPAPQSRNVQHSAQLQRTTAATSGSPAHQVRLTPELRARAQESLRLFDEFSICPNFSGQQLVHLIPINHFFQQATQGLTADQKDYIETKIEQQLGTDPITTEIIRDVPVWFGNCSDPIELSSLIQTTTFSINQHNQRYGHSRYNQQAPTVLHPVNKEDIYPAIEAARARGGFDTDLYMTKRSDYIDYMMAIVEEAKQELGLGTSRPRLPQPPSPEVDFSLLRPSAPPEPRFNQAELAHRISDRRLGAMQRLSAELPTLPTRALEDLYDHLSQFETVIVVDKNHTTPRSTAYYAANNRAQSCDDQINSSVEKLVRIMGCIDPSGVDVIVANNGNVQTSRDVTDLNHRPELRQSILQPGAGPDTLLYGIGEVQELLTDPNKLDRPFHVFVVTGGGWDDLNATKTLLHELALNNGVLDFARLDAGTELNKFQIVHHSVSGNEFEMLDHLDQDDESTPVGGFIDATADYHQERFQFQNAFDRAGVNLTVTEDIYLYKMLKGATMPGADSLDKGDQMSDQFIRDMENLGFPIQRY